VAALQRYLAKYKFYDGPVNGTFDQATTKSVTEYQEYNGITPDGKVGPITKAKILSPRDDTNEFTWADKDNATYSSGQVLNYFVGVCPGYLQQAPVNNEIRRACDTWQAACNIRFEQTTDPNVADIRIEWDDRSKDSLFAFDGPGGALAHTTTKQGILLDSGDYWVLQGNSRPDPMKQKPFELLTVVTHELGHVLGLVHSNDINSVMAPYYVPGKIALTEADKTKIKQLYPGEVNL